MSHKQIEAIVVGFAVFVATLVLTTDVEPGAAWALLMVSAGFWTARSSRRREICCLSRLFWKA